MSPKFTIVIPEAWSLSRSTEAGQVFLTFEVLQMGEKPGEPAAQQRYG